MTGKELKALRQKYKLSREELAQKLEVDKWDIVIMESTKRTIPNCKKNNITEKLQTMFGGA